MIDFVYRFTFTYIKKCFVCISQTFSRYYLIYKWVLDVGISTKVATNKYHKEAAPVLWLVRLLWSVFMCLVFTWDEEGNLKVLRFYHITFTQEYRTLVQSTAEIPSLKWEKHGVTQ